MCFYLKEIKTNFRVLNFFPYGIRLHIAIVGSRINKLGSLVRVVGWGSCAVEVVDAVAVGGAATAFPVGTILIRSASEGANGRRNARGADAQLLAGVRAGGVGRTVGARGVPDKDELALTANGFEINQKNNRENQ